MLNEIESTRGLQASEGLTPSGGLRPTDGIKPSGGIKPSTGIKPTGGLESFRGLEPMGGLASRKKKSRKNIDDAFDNFMPEGLGGGGGRGVFSHPFRVVLVDEEDFEVYNPVLITDAMTGTVATVTGLTGTLTSTTKVWLKTDFTDGLPTAYSVTTTGPSGANRYEFGGSPDFFQTGGWELIGEVVAGVLPEGTPGFAFVLDDDDYYFQQYINTVAELRIQCINGTATWRNVAR